MQCPCYLVIHKSEWNRLKRRPSPEKRKSVNNDYLRALIEQSQNWIKTWPDTVQGHVCQLEKQKEIEHAELIETVNKFVSRKKQEIKMESIRKAREMIFEDSCYGRQLLSALLESKSLEEREQQILFQRKMKRKTNHIEQNEPKASSLQNASEMESIEIRNKTLQKRKDLDVARINQAIAKNERENKMKEREKDKYEASKVELLQKKLLEQEIKTKINKANLEKHLTKEFEADREQIIKLRKQREEEDERRREIYKKYQERIKNKEKNIFNQIFENKTNALQMQHVHNIIKNTNDEKNKQYNDFVDKGVKRWINSEKILEKTATERKIIERNKRRLLDEENKALAELQKQFQSQENNKHICCIQSFIGNPCNRQKINIDKTRQAQPPRKKLLSEKLKKREKEPSPWSSLNTAHMQFAEHAEETLKQCRFKHMARKVIHDYRKINGLNATTLPIHD